MAGVQVAVVVGDGSQSFSVLRRSRLGVRGLWVKLPPLWGFGLREIHVQGLQVRMKEVYPKPYVNLSRAVEVRAARTNSEI